MGYIKHQLLYDAGKLKHKTYFRWGPYKILNKNVLHKEYKKPINFTIESVPLAA